MSRTFELTLENAQDIVDKINGYAPSINVSYMEGGMSPFCTELKLAILDGDFIKIIVPNQHGLMDQSWIDLSSGEPPVRVTFRPDQVIIEWGDKRHDVLIIYTKQNR